MAKPQAILLNPRVAVILLAWWWLGYGSVFFWILLADYCAWLLAYSERDCDPAVFRKSDFPDQIYEYAPSRTFHFYFGDRHLHKKIRAVETTINSHGFRGPEIEEKNESNKLRIMVLGDSFSFGAGVADGLEFVRLVEKDWNGNGAFPGEVEFINASVGGYNTTQAVATLLRHRERYRPDMVWLFISLEDTFDWGTVVVREDGTLFRPGAPFRFRIRRAMRHASGIIWWLDYAERYRRGDTYIPSLFHPGFAGYQEWKKALQHYADAVGSPERSLVFIAPAIWKLKRYPWKHIHEHIQAEAESLGLICVDLFPAVEGQDMSRLWCHPLDLHPNTEAHGRFADFILRHPTVLEQVENRITDPGRARA